MTLSSPWIACGLQDWVDHDGVTERLDGRRGSSHPSSDPARGGGGSGEWRWRCFADVQRALWCSMHHARGGESAVQAGAKDVMGDEMKWTHMYEIQFKLTSCQGMPKCSQLSTAQCCDDGEQWTVTTHSHAAHPQWLMV